MKVDASIQKEEFDPINLKDLIEEEGRSFPKFGGKEKDVLIMKKYNLKMKS